MELEEHILQILQSRLESTHLVNLDKLPFESLFMMNIYFAK
jgi:hypothetical protein